MPRRILVLLGLVLSACTPPSTTESSTSYLYLWSASTDATAPDFLAVVDATEASPAYGQVVTTLPVPGRQHYPHHTEHEMPADRQLFANGFDQGQSWVFDLTNPVTPRIVTQFGDLEALSHPHSFLRLPNGNVLATYQMQHQGTAMRAGGLVEMTPAGHVVRSRSADSPGTDPALRVYSAGVVPTLDRIVTTSTDMNGSAEASRTLQVWRLSDLAPLTSLTLPGDQGLLTAEPRLLADGRRLLVSTFSCGLFLIDGLEGTTPTVRQVGSFPRKDKTNCAIPVVAGNFYLVTVPAWSAVVSLDITDPSQPREVSRLAFGADDVPHWISLSPDKRRVVVTGYKGMQHRVYVLHFDATTGQLSMDERFRDEGAAEAGVRMDNKTWPHGGKAAAIPHGAVFSRAQ